MGELEIVSNKFSYYDEENKMVQNLAIIPARSGSKGLPDKNIKLLNGKPLIAYSIEAALRSGMFEEVMVSTDSSRYGEIAKQFGASVPFLRSQKTSSDTASSWDMVREVLNSYHELGRSFQTFCLLQPTSPLRVSADIINAYQIFKEKGAIAVVSVCEMEHSPLWCNTLKEGEELDGFISEEKQRPRQVLEKYYRLNGAVYIADVDEFYKNDFLYRKGSYAYIMSQETSVDIDSEFDFKIAETLLDYTGGGV